MVMMSLWRLHGMTSATAASRRACKHDAFCSLYFINSMR